MTDYVYRDGARLTPYMAYQVGRLDADFAKKFDLHIKVTSGIRLPSEQLALWNSRYTLNPGNKTIYDRRWYKGQLWYNISPDGTVAQPGTSNHEIQGTKAAMDFADTGEDAGVSVAGSERSNWLRANAGKYGLIASGFTFGEAWHYDIPNIYTAVPSGGGSSSLPSSRKKRNNMSTGVIHTNGTDDKTRKGAIVDFEAGTFSPFGWFPVSYANGVAKGFGLEGSAPVTEGHYAQIKASAAAAASAAGKLFVDINDADVPKIGS